MKGIVQTDGGTDLVFFRVLWGWPVRLIHASMPSEAPGVQTGGREGVIELGIKLGSCLPLLVCKPFFLPYVATKREVVRG